MARIEIILKKARPSYGAGGPTAPVPFARLKATAIVLGFGLLLIGLLIAVFVVGSIVAAVILVLLIVSVVILMIRIVLGHSRRP